MPNEDGMLLCVKILSRDGNKSPRVVASQIYTTGRSFVLRDLLLAADFLNVSAHLVKRWRIRQPMLLDPMDLDEASVAWHLLGVVIVVTVYARPDERVEHDLTILVDNAHFDGDVAAL